jgi:hypothetical protein
MRLAPRLKRLERGYGRHTCSECGGKGRVVTTHRYHDEPMPEVEGCPACGEVLHLDIVYKHEPLPGQSVPEPPRTMTAEQLGALYR